MKNASPIMGWRFSLCDGCACAGVHAIGIFVRCVGCLRNTALRQRFQGTLYDGQVEWSSAKRSR
ncbi:hypothetical protein BIFPSEUDO_02462 [Bifidobacterium pseudocatenulatum DSM 20438 = JCM 1200 = LMG 10505]|uniref:Uncharacterized protein n=1 Tax=Bifidobacterium pseudocatenulatum DSM 20438 = JCM 1200 = LMG 10505 TaxID=547043 RepID=C0BQ23_BIFPS|nr:hypothetical protein BIFPSEUDO_02462 [Bifidobacterium pseudocatenulatum DSM 20438 = JCM 1200 = LMG 10505]